MDPQNSTGPLEQETKTSAKTVSQAVLLVIFIVLGTYGNFRTIHKILSDTLRMQVTLNLFIAVISFCDLGMCVLVMPVAFVSLVSDRWVFGNIACKIHFVTMIYLAQVTALCIAMVVFERYLTICRRRYPSLSRKCALCLIVVFFVLPIPFSLPYYRQHIAYFPSTGMCFLKHAKYQIQLRYISLVDTLVLKAFPFAVDLFSFWKVFLVLRRLKRRVGPGLLSSEDKLTATAHAHSAGTTLAFLLTYFGLNLPLYFSLVTHWRSVVNGHSGISRDAMAASLWSFWLECIVKPLIYDLRNRRQGSNYLTRRFPSLSSHSIRERLRRRRRNLEQIYRCEDTGVPQADQNVYPGPEQPVAPKLAFGSFTDLEVIEVEPENGRTRSKRRMSGFCLDDVASPQGVSIGAIRNPDETAREGNKLIAALSTIMRKSRRVHNENNVEEFESPSISHHQVSAGNSPRAQVPGNEEERCEMERSLPVEETVF